MKQNINYKLLLCGLLLKKNHAQVCDAPNELFRQQKPTAVLLRVT